MDLGGVFCTGLGRCRVRSACTGLLSALQSPLGSPEVALPFLQLLVVLPDLPLTH